MTPPELGPPPKRRKPLRRRPLHYEQSYWERGIELVAGVDETGRGPLAGPVVAAAVILPIETGITGAVDSKRLHPAEREELSREILATAVAVGIGAASVREIDRINILRASGRAMRRAIEHLRPGPQHVVIDGNPLAFAEWDHDAVVGGDDKVHSIACASIVAKVCRDRLMRRLDPRYPGYGWAHNAGYATAEHMDAVRELGVTPHHRRSFLNFQLELGLGSAEPAGGRPARPSESAEEDVADDAGPRGLDGAPPASEVSGDDDVAFAG